MKGNFTPGPDKIPPNTGTFQLDRGVYDVIGHSVANYRVTEGEWVNIMCNEINEFKPYCAYVNTNHRWNKGERGVCVVFKCNLYCKFDKCTSRWEITHYKDEGVLFHFRC